MANVRFPPIADVEERCDVRMMAGRTDFPGPLKAELDELEAFDAMRLFLEAYWQRGGKSSDDIAVLLGSLNRTTGPPLDLAQWYDWREAVAKARAQRQQQ